LGFLALLVTAGKVLEELPITSLPLEEARNDKGLEEDLGFSIWEAAFILLLLHPILLQN
jgi:hypothetical protein